ncbi:5-formyltetrahydrofolate cyclo-ligase [Saccharococcus thermophilus]|uniref:5-formyltetrahydrofolate cyclo-ligase n=1 Tax=Saccharococcus thermophilus TaxID=29396 RepID=A0A846MIA9_9BACL|nr:5-formyltetrahydrofolate cyclo-ligase [Saccharococcus thermophilus]NIK15414.1 5-formyltetrahydrofolate cyclo-ligase [Saccharococcus thermophilus]
METKKQIRKTMQAKLQQLTDEEKQAYDKQIAENLYRLPQWKNADTIAITISKGKEIDTTPIIKRAWSEGKTVSVPKCDPATKTMVFRQITSFSQLESSYFGLLEPIEALTSEIKKSDMDMIIVPGICFSKNGYRIGYGGGYYDRYLRNVSAPTVSLAYSFQVVDFLPIEEHDVPVQMIITNEGVIQCNE